MVYNKLLHPTTIRPRSEFPEGIWDRSYPECALNVATSNAELNWNVPMRIAI